MSGIGGVLRRLWRGIREASGDAAYDRYREHAGGEPPLSREQFWLDTLRRRYSGPSRCC
jgi:uncharacterized short protein YbdD (DUF466 family)